MEKTTETVSKKVQVADKKIALAIDQVRDIIRVVDGLDESEILLEMTTGTEVDFYNKSYVLYEAVQTGQFMRFVGYEGSRGKRRVLVTALDKGKLTDTSKSKVKEYQEFFSKILENVTGMESNEIRTTIIFFEDTIFGTETKNNKKQLEIKQMLKSVGKVDLIIMCDFDILKVGRTIIEFPNIWDGEIGLNFVVNIHSAKNIRNKFRAANFIVDHVGLTWHEKYKNEDKSIEFYEKFDFENQNRPEYILTSLGTLE